MFGMEDENRREAVGFVIKQITMIIGAAAVLLFGTAHLGKIDQEQLLKAKLKGDTDILSLSHGPYEAPNSESTFCFISGSYQVENTGKYPFKVNTVTIELWELPYIQDKDLDEKQPISYSLSERIQGNSKFPAKKIGDTVEIVVNEQFGVGGFLQRSFGFIVPISEPDKLLTDVGSRYIVVANSAAGLDNRVPWYSKITHFVAGDSGIGFFENDLRHMTATFNICEAKKESS